MSGRIASHVVLNALVRREPLYQSEARLRESDQAGWFELDFRYGEMDWEHAASLSPAQALALAAMLMEAAMKATRPD